MLIDMMTFLYENYKKYLTDLGNQEDPTVVFDEQDNYLPFDSFINWCKLYFNNTNSPVNIAYLPVGIGLRMQSGDVLYFQDQTRVDQHIDYSIPITRENPMLPFNNPVHQKTYGF